MSSDGKSAEETKYETTLCEQDKKGKWHLTTDKNSEFCPTMPTVRFDRYAVVFHFIYWPQGSALTEEPYRSRCERAWGLLKGLGAKFAKRLRDIGRWLFGKQGGEAVTLGHELLDRNDKLFEQIERDLVAYSSRERIGRPFRSFQHSESNQIIPVTFPQMIEYQGEAKRYHLHIGSPEDRTVSCNTVVSHTVMTGNRAVVMHIGLIPADDSESESERTDGKSNEALLKSQETCRALGAVDDQTSREDETKPKRQAAERQRTWLKDFELVQLVKLWEGGEGFDSESVKFGEDNQSICQFAQKVFEGIRDEEVRLNEEEVRKGGKKRSAYLPYDIDFTNNSSGSAENAEKFSETRQFVSLFGGTVQLVDGKVGNADESPRRRLDASVRGVQAFRILEKFKQSEDDKRSAKTSVKGNDSETTAGLPNTALPPEEANAENEKRLDLEERWVAAVIKGIETGLLDVFNTDGSEVEDSLKGFERVGQDQLYSANKGTVIGLFGDDRIYDNHRKSVAATPYLWLPHIVGIFNDVVLRIASRCYESGRFNGTEDAFQGTEIRLRELIQQDHLDNVFHYDLERNLFKSVSKTRGLDTAYLAGKDRLQAINGILDELRERRQRMLEWMLQFFLGSFAIFQVMSSYRDLRVLATTDRDGVDEFWYMALVAVVIVMAMWGLSINQASTPYKATKRGAPPVLMLLSLWGLVGLAFWILQHWVNDPDSPFPDEPAATSPVQPADLANAAQNVQSNLDTNADKVRDALDRMSQELRQATLRGECSRFEIEATLKLDELTRRQRDLEVQLGKVLEASNANAATSEAARGELRRQVDGVKLQIKQLAEFVGKLRVEISRKPAATTLTREQMIWLRQLAARVKSIEESMGRWERQSAEVSQLAESVTKLEGEISAIVLAIQTVSVAQEQQAASIRAIPQVIALQMQLQQSFMPGHAREPRPVVGPLQPIRQLCTPQPRR